MSESDRCPRCPEGALSGLEREELRVNHPETMVYFVGEPTGIRFDTTDRWGIISGQAKRFAFTCAHPEHYFTNYLLALGYALRYREALAKADKGGS